MPSDKKTQATKEIWFHTDRYSYLCNENNIDFFTYYLD